MSLFVDSSKIIEYLERDWGSEQQILLNIPSDSMFKLSSILKTLAELLNGDKAAQYMAIIGDLRKVKRFVNATLLMQIEKTDLSKTDFNRQDLINLLLLHLNYPDVFRRIYVEETEGRSGMFSTLRNVEKPHFSNSTDFNEFVKNQDSNAEFILKQLFDVENLELDADHGSDAIAKSYRACFNDEKYRNLENYLKLIVRFVTPEPRETFVLYQKAVERIIKNNAISTELDRPDFNLEYGEKSHDQFWRLLVNQSHNFTSLVAEDAIDTLLNYLPKYSSFDTPDIHQGLRSRSIYSLVSLLDKAGWGRTNGQRRPNNHENIAQIADRIFGEGDYENKGIIYLLAAEERGVLGWEDLMSFRLACSADRQGKLYNVYSSLVLHQDKTARTDGLVSILAVNGMRQLSQEIFALFKERYIEPKCNFLAEIKNTQDVDFLGSSADYFNRQEENLDVTERSPLAEYLETARSSIQIFVIYQLCNNKSTTGTGVGCGFYDENGKNDSSGIAKLMNDYVFNVCFNPNIDEKNVLYFVNYCLLNFERSYGRCDVEYLPTQTSLFGALDSSEMSKYWQEHRECILGKNLTNIDQRIITSNYIATYSEDLQSVFDVLDKMSEQSKD